MAETRKLVTPAPDLLRPPAPNLVRAPGRANSGRGGGAAHDAGVQGHQRAPAPGSRLALRLAAVTIALVVALVLSLAGSNARDTSAELRAFAQAVGLTPTDEFVETITSLRETQRLPPRYITKKKAAALGWKPGADLCRAAPGRAIGGDVFGNREKRLPEAAGRRWREADLDYACGQRNAKRLVWSSDGLIFVTVDHYTTFKEVPK